MSSSDSAPPSKAPETGMELRSTVTDDGKVTVALHHTEISVPRDDEVLVRVEAAPINPSDLGMLFAGADIASAEGSESEGLPGVSIGLTARALSAQAKRLGKPMPVGNEGGGTVIAAGASDEAQALLGRVVGFLSGDAYADFRTLNVAQCLPMDEGTTAEQAAAAFVNPLTALGMTETMRTEGHSALVHTVGASNLGKMLNRICLDDNIGLVNIVRSKEQVALLRDQGAEHVCNSSADSFIDDLTDALRATGATIAFDAIGGGEMAGTLLSAMEKVAAESAGEFSRYGSDTLKQVYIYGGLDRGPTTLRRDFGMSWSIGGWLLTPFLGKLGKEGAEKLRRRVANEITTTFASSYGMRLSLPEAVDPEHVRRYGRAATGEKALVTPHA